MNGEQNSNTITGVVAGIIILVLIVLGLVVWNRAGDTNEDSVPAQNDQQIGGNTLDQQATLVTHTFDSGVHTYTGSIKAPTPCHTVSYEVELSVEPPIKPTIHFTINEPSPEQICTQVVTDIPFTVRFEAPENSAQAEATLNGKPFFIIIGGKE